MPCPIVCKACGLEKERNYRLGEKKQEYCDAQECRRAYRREYQKRRMHDEPEYGQKQKACKVRFRKLSGATFQRGYRKNNPDYEKKNREQQPQRNAKRRSKAVSEPKAVPSPDPVIVKMNSCTLIKPDTYLITLNPGERVELIVKMNSCNLEFSKGSRDSVDSIQANQPVRVIVTDSMDSAEEIRDIPAQKSLNHESHL